jgi:peptidoglycan/LPS O-acetylase OafA/YrhL
MFRYRKANLREGRFDAFSYPVVGSNKVSTSPGLQAPAFGSGGGPAGSSGEPVRHAGRGIPSLTGIRGIAAAWVFMTHFQIVLAEYLHTPGLNDNAFMFNGFRGVDLFFVLSGFILMHVHGRDFRSLSYNAMHDFYVLRLFRIYPLNTLVLLLLLPIGLAMPDLVHWMRYDHGVPIPYHNHDFSASGFVQSLLLLQTETVLKLGEWNGPSWTLSAELFGYAVFPFLAYRLVRQRSAFACALLAAVSLTVLVVLLVAFGHAHRNPTGLFGLVRMIFCFMAGMCLSLCYQLWRQGERFATAITLGSLAFIAVTVAVQAAEVLIVFGFAGLIFGLAYRRGPINTLLETRPAMFLGRISFSFYLIHYIPLKLSVWLLQTYFSETTLAFRVSFLVALVTSLVVLATLTHRFLEVPFQRLARRMLNNAPTPAGSVRLS